MSMTRPSDAAGTTTVVQSSEGERASASLHLHLHAEPAANTSTETVDRVKWTTDTVDNEGMGKKKSKCCCIYKKKRKFDESDTDESDEEGETDHCRGHVEAKGGHGHEEGKPKCDCH